MATGRLTGTGEAMFVGARGGIGEAVLVLRLLVQGASIRSIGRVTEVHRDAFCRLLILVGEKGQTIMGRRVRNVPVKDVECDEIWGYVGEKEAHKSEEESADIENEQGNSYCFVAIERNGKLVINFSLGKR